MGPARVWVVWGGGIFLVLGVFLIFVAAGWPGGPNSCLHVVNGVLTPDANGHTDQCYCEAFDFQKVMSHAPGVRQPVNTWFNLYSIVTSFIVALFMYLDRVAGRSDNLMRSDSPIADAYVFAVLFLGLGSMWFHASLTTGVAWMDGFSMYVYAAFLVFYTVRRLWASDLFFWIAYPATVVAFTIIGNLWTWEYSSLVLILILVAAYLALEFTVGGIKGNVLLGRALTYWLWGLAVAAILLATLFWALSQTGRPLCNPTSFFQPHGLLWHPLAGVMATLLYFYWREEPAAS
jgi:hypothetical protein